MDMKAHCATVPLSSLLLDYVKDAREHPMPSEALTTSPTRDRAVKTLLLLASNDPATLASEVLTFADKVITI